MESIKSYPHYHFTICKTSSRKTETSGILLYPILSNSLIFCYCCLFGCYFFHSRIHSRSLPDLSSTNIFIMIILVLFFFFSSINWPSFLPIQYLPIHLTDIDTKYILLGYNCTTVATSTVTNQGK